MINSTTLISIMIIFIVYMIVIFTMKPQMRKLLKIWLYILVFLGLLFPDFNGIGELKLNLETYAIVVTGVELFEMIFKYVIEIKMNEQKRIGEKTKKIYESL